MKTWSKRMSTLQYKSKQCFKQKNLEQTKASILKVKVYKFKFYSVKQRNFNFSITQ